MLCLLIEKAASCEIFTVAVAIFVATTPLVAAAVKVCPCLDVQTSVAALLMFTTADDTVYFETARGALVQECIDLYLQDSFLFLFFNSAVLPPSSLVWGPPSHLVVLSGTVLCLSSFHSQDHVPMYITKGVSNAKIRL